MNRTLGVLVAIISSTLFGLGLHSYHTEVLKRTATRAFLQGEEVTSAKYEDKIDVLVTEHETNLSIVKDSLSRQTNKVSQLSWEIKTLQEELTQSKEVRVQELKEQSIKHDLQIQEIIEFYEQAIIDTVLAERRLRTGYIHDDNQVILYQQEDEIRKSGIAKRSAHGQMKSSLAKQILITILGIFVVTFLGAAVQGFLYRYR